MTPNQKCKIVGGGLTASITTPGDTPRSDATGISGLFLTGNCCSLNLFWQLDLSTVNYKNVKKMAHYS